MTNQLIKLHAVPSQGIGFVQLQHKGLWRHKPVYVVQVQRGGAMQRGHGAGNWYRANA